MKTLSSMCGGTSKDWVFTQLLKKLWRLKESQEILELGQYQSPLQIVECTSKFKISILPHNRQEPIIRVYDPKMGDNPNFSTVEISLPTPEQLPTMKTTLPFVLETEKFTVYGYETDAECSG